MSASNATVRFAWSEAMVGERVGLYPEMEGDRTQAAGADVWTPVETCSRAELEEIQAAKLRRLLGIVAERSPFYRELWQSAGVDVRSVQGPADLADFPLVRKEDVAAEQRAHPPFGLATSDPHGAAHFWQTSGTTAAPVAWVDTKEDWDNGMYLYARSLYGHGVRRGWRAYFGFSYPPFIGFWLAHYASEMMGCQVVPKGPLPGATWLRLMERMRGTAPAFLCATPTFAQRQLEVATETGIEADSLGIELLSLAGEPGGCVPATKAALEGAWDARVHDIMGSTETSGPVLFTCQAQAAVASPSPHVNADYFIVEVLDPGSLAPVSQNEPGLLAVTALGRFGMPAVRFLLSDMVQLSWEQCACGRTLPLIVGGIRARADDVVIVKGVNVYPSMVQDVLHSIPALSPEYLLVRERHSARLLIEARDTVGEPNELAMMVQRRLAEAITVTLPVEVVASGTLPRGEAKSQRVVTELEEAGEGRST